MLYNLILLAPAVIFLGAVAVRFWSTAILTVLAWSVVEGAARKWVLPGYQAELLLLKDFILLFSYLGYVISANRDRSLGPKSGVLLMLIGLESIYCFMQLMNPNSPSAILAIVGVKNYLIYLPLAFIMADVIKGKVRLRKFLLAIAMVSIPVSMIGLYQFSQPPTAWVNQYVSHEEGVEAISTTFGSSGEEDFKDGRVRTSSTFSYIGGFTTFLLLSVPLCAALLMSSVMTWRWQLVVATSLLLSVGGALTTGSRTPMVIFAVSAPLMLLIAGAKGLLPLQSAVRFAVFGGLLSIAAVTTLGTAISAFEYRANNSDSAIKRYLAPVVETMNAYEASPVIGTGIGTTANSAMSILGGGEFAWWLNGQTFEVESARVMQELGFIGFFLVYLPKLFAIILILHALKRSKSPLMIVTHLTAFVFVGAHFVLFTVNNPTGGLFYWTMIGVSIAASRIEFAERRALQQEAEYLAKLQWRPIDRVIRI